MILKMEMTDSQLLSAILKNNWLNLRGENILIHLIIRNREDLIDELMKTDYKGYDDCRSGAPPIHYAIGRNFKSIVLKLIPMCDLLIKYGKYTPLKLAYIKGDEEIIKCMKDELEKRNIHLSLPKKLMYGVLEKHTFEGERECMICYEYSTLLVRCNNNLFHTFCDDCMKKIIETKRCVCNKDISDLYKII